MPPKEFSGQHVLNNLLNRNVYKRVQGSCSFNTRPQVTVLIRHHSKHLVKLIRLASCGCRGFQVTDSEMGWSLELSRGGVEGGGRQCGAVEESRPE